MILVLKEIKPETSDVTSFIFEPKEQIIWKAGQFFHHVLHHEPTDARGSDRWFTNASAPFENTVRITTRLSEDKASSFKKKLAGLAIGKKIEVSHVGGDFLVDDVTKEYVFIAGGIGITPFRSILKQLDHEGKQIHATLLYANRDTDVIYKDELEELAKRNPYLTIHYVFSPQHIDAVKITEVVPDIVNKMVYISGPEPMVDSMGEVVTQMGVSKEHLIQDWFPNYPLE